MRKKQVFFLHSLALSRRIRICHEFAFHSKALKNIRRNYESVESIHSSNVVEFESELRHISTHVSYLFIMWQKQNT